MDLSTKENTEEATGIWSCDYVDKTSAQFSGKEYLENLGIHSDM